MYDQINSTELVQQGKSAWKQDHPDETLKHYKNLYVKGHIDSLPWENYTSKNESTYQQNSEQNPNSLFSKIQQRKNESN